MSCVNSLPTRPQLADLGTRVRTVALVPEYMLASFSTEVQA